MTSGDDIIRDNPRESRYDMIRDGERLGEIRYRTEPGLIVLTHTEVMHSATGQGIGSRLVSGVLADIRSRGLHVVPECTFVADYMRRHPEQRDVLAPDATH
ncbi:N-acetyltransferase [Actinobacteria bacterium YIM 96077]|uniref:GNAT family N-acetyltransferase n=1 Tax=Phytoactinopolyspora halophila TaxID=1981511 RepID=A0A329QHG7_9ACTN|nr:GNAT family N-acetyltransferase [Phytoactinopolyspora halophila]AYY15429.1 N-acetyltransferase [Actinobacteria bacterium YIM 96077]RAW11179.1 GNAT family N-acetyltransferase [Phytoactinopolyspora halophila]